MILRIRIFLLMILVALFLAGCGGARRSGEDSRYVTQEFRYHMPEAGEVILVWGVNGWKALPEELRPPGTVIVDGVMQTTMHKDGEFFVAPLRLPEWTTVHYGFLITRRSDGMPIEAVWDGSEAYQALTPLKDGVIEVESTLKQPQVHPTQSAALASTVKQEFRYNMPEAGEVFLVWGVNGWQVLPEAMRPAGTVVKDKVMHTPMVREGEFFVASLQVDPGAVIDYGFLITRSSKGAEIIPIWDGNEDFRIRTTGQDSVLEVKSTATLSLNLDWLTVWYGFFYILVALAVVLLVVVVFQSIPGHYRRWVSIILLVGILILGLGLRIAGSIEWNSTHPNTQESLIGDEPTYDGVARAFLEGYGFTWPGRVPLYPLWLAMVYWFSGGSINAVPYFQSILSLATIVLTYLLGRKAFGEMVGLIAAFWVAGSYILIQQSFHLLSEALFTPVLVLVILTLFEAMRAPSTKRFILAGICVGLSNLIRPTLLFFPIFILILLIFILPWREALKNWAIYLVTSLLVVTPWIVHNYLQYRAIFLLQTSNAILWQGSPEYYHLIHDEGYSYKRIWDEILYDPGSEQTNPSSIAGERYWTRRALQSIISEPLVYLKYAGEKSFTFWVGDPYADWGGERVFSYLGLRLIGYSPREALQVIFARLLPFLALGALIMIRPRRTVVLAFLGLFVYFTLLHALTHAEARLSEPLQPLLLIVVAVGAVALFTRVVDVRAITEKIGGIQPSLKENEWFRRHSRT